MIETRALAERHGERTSVAVSHAGGAVPYPRAVPSHDVAGRPADRHGVGDRS